LLVCGGDFIYDFLINQFDPPTQMGWIKNFNGKEKSIMFYLKKKRLVFYALTLLFIFSPYIFFQDHPYVVDKELLDIIQN